MNSNLGLVLTGGGARGAYQAGVIAAVYQILKEEGRPNPFRVLTGSSAGAINSCLLANFLAQGLDPQIEMERIWTNLTNDKVFKSDTISLMGNGFDWFKTLTFGGLGRPTHKILSLLDTAPLRDLLEENINFEEIDQGIKNGVIDSLAISAINYNNGISRTSFMASGEIKEWVREKRLGLRTDLSIDHVMASSAIPLLFPPIYVDNCYHGDGSLRDYTPLSPSIKLGAEKLFVVGVRKRQMSQSASCLLPTPGRLVSMILNGILLDAVDLDYERLQRINHTLKKIPEGNTGELKQIDIFMVTPSQLLSSIAEEEAEKMGNVLQFLLKGLGDVKDAADIISYILFEKCFTSRVFELGQKDMLGRKKEFLSFI